MKRLITTTAVAALLATPVAAQQTAQTTQSGQAGASATAAGQLEIEASNLIGKRLYIQREAGSAGTAAMPRAAGTDAAIGTDQTARQAGQQPAGDAQTEQAQGQQPVQGGQTQSADQAVAPQGGQAPAEMADLEQGVSDVPDSWTMAGEIDDVLLTQDGQVEALVIDAGGFLGMNESTRRVAIDDVRFVPDTDDEGEFFAVYTGGRETFEQSERFDEAALREGSVRGTEMWGDEIAGQQADVAFTSITTDELVGTAVYGSEDNWVGEIGEIALTEDGEIEAVIIDVGGFLGIGQKPVALSMDQIQLRRGDGGLFGDDLRAYVNATEEELESMEAWEEDAG